jgi:hypothetical protein
VLSELSQFFEIGRVEPSLSKQPLIYQNFYCPNGAW